MLKKESWIYITDNTNVKWIKIFQLYKGFSRKTTTYGFFVKGSARIVEPPRLEYKGFKYKFKIKGDIIKSIIVRTKKKRSTKSGKHVSFNDNSSILINKKFNIQSKYINGTTIKNIKRKKIINLFKVII